MNCGKSSGTPGFPVGLRMLAMGLLLLGIPTAASGGGTGPWHGRQCAVVLTYDDALNVHLDNVIPLLDSLGFKGTFYVTGNFPGFKHRVKDWAKAAANGHELGNHTLFHPCDGRPHGREWVSREYDLSQYSISRMVDEIQLANTLLESIDGKAKRTFAYPCGDMKAGDSSYVDQIRTDFSGARGVGALFATKDSVDRYNVGAFMVNGQSGDVLKYGVQEALKKASLLVFLFHGVGGEHSINVSASDHRALVHYLKENETQIWVAPLVDIVEYLKETQSPNSRQ